MTVPGAVWATYTKFLSQTRLQPSQLKKLHQQSDDARDHERCSPHQVQIEPCLPENE